MNWFDTELIYFNTTMSVERAIGSLFGMMSDVVDIFDLRLGSTAFTPSIGHITVKIAQGCQLHLRVKRSLCR